MPFLTIIVAKAANNVIGRDNALPWHLPEDLKHFKLATTGHPIIMGRKTFEAIGRPLPNRQNIVVSRNHRWSAEGTEAVASLEAAIALCQDKAEAFIIGGAELFAEALPRVSRLIVTELHREYEGDTFFPEIPAEFHEVSRESHAAAADAKLRFDFVCYER